MAGQALKTEEAPQEPTSSTLVPSLPGNDELTSVSKSGTVLRRLKPPLTEKATSRWKSSPVLTRGAHSYGQHNIHVNSGHL